MALSEIEVALFAVVRACGLKVDIPNTEDLLRGWGLPIMAEAVDVDEKERKAIELLRSVQRLAAKQKRNNAGE